MSNPYTVAKFGGTSVANHQSMSRCADIVLNNPQTKVVVVSASAGVTNHLVSLTKSGLSAQQRITIVSQISEIEHAILNDLAEPEAVRESLEQLLAELSELALDPMLTASALKKDRMLAFGEQMSSLLVSQVCRELGIKAVNFDVREVIKTDSQFAKAQPNVEATRLAAQRHLLPLLEDSVVITQGFIGSDSAGYTTTLGRGGSDYSAALLAEAITAETVQIWTDVIGIYTTDPRLTASARPIPEISFDEAAEMATFGAKILHPATLIPAMRAGTRVFVGSSKAPEDGGTWIAKNVTHKPGYRAIALRKEQVLVTLKSPSMLHAAGFLAQVFSILAKHQVSVDLITTSEISVAITIDDPDNGASNVLTEGLVHELSEVCEISIDRGLNLVAIIGNHLEQTSGFGGELLSALKDYNLRMICHGASQHNLCFLVPENQGQEVVAQLHDRLFAA